MSSLLEFIRQLRLISLQREVISLQRRMLALNVSVKELQLSMLDFELDIVGLDRLLAVSTKCEPLPDTRQAPQEEQTISQPTKH